MSAGGKEVGRISIRVLPDTDNFRKILEAKLKAIEDGLRVKIKIVPDLDGFREKVKAATEGISDVKVDVDVDSAGAKAHMDALMAELRAKAAKDVKVNVDVDTNSVSRAAGGIAGGFSGLPHLSRGLLITAAVAAFAAPALALVSGALLVLPALASAVVTPIAAVALGLDGLKKAATVLMAPLDNLKKTMSTAFQTQFTPIFTQLTSVFPMLNAQLPKITTGLSDMARAFVDTVTSQSGMQRISSTIGNIGKALSDSAPGVGNFTNGLLTLVDKVAAKLPNLSKMFNGWGESFSKWINKITREDWTGKSPLDRGMHSFKETMQEILNIVGDLAKKGFEFLSDPEFGKKMKEFVSDVKDLVTNVLPALGDFFKDLVKTIDEIRDAWHDVFGGGKDPKTGEPKKPFIRENKDGPSELTPKAPDQQSIITNMQHILETLNPALLLTKLFAVIPWDSLWAGLTTSATTAWNGVVTIAQTALGTISLVGNGFSAMWDGLTSSASMAWEGVRAIFSAGVAGLSSVWSGIASAATGAWNAVVSAVSGAINQIVSAVQQGVATVLGIFQALPGQIAGALSGAAGALAGAGKALMDGLLGGIREGLKSVLDFVSTIAGQIAAHKGPLPKDRITLTPAGHALMDGLQDGLEGGLQGVLSRARQVAQQISDAIKSGGPIDSSGLKRSLDELDLERKQLKVEQDQTTDKGRKAELRDQMAQIQAVRDELSLQSEQLGFSKKYGDKQDVNSMGAQANKMLDIVKGFGQANLSQFENDIGISGNGAIPQLADQGLSWLSGMLSKAITGGMGGGTTINVGSIDEALTADRTIKNREALQYNRR